jgi:hypothetical protein
MDDARGDIQAVAPRLTLAARIAHILGRDERGRELVESALTAVSEASVRAPGPRADMMLAVYTSGFGEAWLELAHAQFAETGRVWLGRLICSGQLTDAAELVAHIGAPHEEAVIRLAAAEQLLAHGRRADAGAQLELAVPYFERAGATRILVRAESLFAAAS